LSASEWGIQAGSSWQIGHRVGGKKDGPEPHWGLKRNKFPKNSLTAVTLIIGMIKNINPVNPFQMSCLFMYSKETDLAAELRYTNRRSNRRLGMETYLPLNRKMMKFIVPINAQNLQESCHLHNSNRRQTYHRNSLITNFLHALCLLQTVNLLFLTCTKTFIMT